MCIFHSERSKATRSFKKSKWNFNCFEFEDSSSGGRLRVCTLYCASEYFHALANWNNEALLWGVANFVVFANKTLSSHRLWWFCMQRMWSIVCHIAWWRYVYIYDTRTDSIEHACHSKLISRLYALHEMHADCSCWIYQQRRINVDCIDAENLLSFRTSFGPYHFLCTATASNGRNVAIACNWKFVRMRVRIHLLDGITMAKRYVGHNWYCNFHTVAYRNRGGARHVSIRSKHKRRIREIHTYIVYSLPLAADSNRITFEMRWNDQIMNEIEPVVLLLY